MFIREIWGKFTSFIFWNFEISLVLLWKFQNFKKVNSVHLSQIFLLNMWLLVLIKVDIRMFLEWENNSGKLQIISREFQNNAINDVKQISLNHVISLWTLALATLQERAFKTVNIRCASATMVFPGKARYILFWNNSLTQAFLLMFIDFLWQSFDYWSFDPL